MLPYFSPIKNSEKNVMRIGNIFTTLPFWVEHIDVKLWSMLSNFKLFGFIYYLSVIIMHSDNLFDESTRN